MKLKAELPEPNKIFHALKRLQVSVEKIQLNTDIYEDTSLSLSLDDLLNEKLINKLYGDFVYEFEREAEILSNNKSYKDTFGEENEDEKFSSCSSAPGISETVPLNEEATLPLEIGCYDEDEKLLKEMPNGLSTDLNYLNSGIKLSKPKLPSLPFNSTSPNPSLIAAVGGTSKLKPLKRPGSKHIIRRLCSSSFKRMIPQKARDISTGNPFKNTEK